MRGRHSPGRPPGLPPPPPPPQAPPPPPPGPRRAALEDRRKRARNRALLLGAAAVLLVAGIGLVLAQRDSPEDVRERDEDAAVARPAQPTSALLAGTRAPNGGRHRLSWVALLVLGPDRATVLHIPAPTATEVPGRGPHSLAEAYASGGISLLVLAAENLLGARVDRYVDVAESDARDLFGALEPLEVDVPAAARIPGDDGTTLLFEPGPQAVDADALAAYLYRPGEDADPEELAPRHLALWSALGARGAADPGGLRRALDDASHAFETSNEEPEEVARFLAAFLGGGSRPAMRSLPVEPLDAPGDPLYVTDEDELRAFVAETVAPELLFGAVTRVQILNGNGTPGLGERVARRLVGNGFRVVLTGNARSLNHRRTLVIAYDAGPEARREAARARELLGVGEVQVSLQEQGIVDLTIVVGRDFLRAR